MPWKDKSIHSQELKTDWLVIGAAMLGLALAVFTSVQHDPSQERYNQSHHIHLTIGN